MFMNAVGQQMAIARGTTSGQCLALAQACDITACDGVSPFSVWASALGGLGKAQGDSTSTPAPRARSRRPCRGAPFAGFIVYGATPQPDSAVVSFQANTRIAESAQLYLRYDGDIGSGMDNHALNLGVRLSW